MSDAQLTARKAKHELQVTEEAHDAYRIECIEAAIKLAAKGMKDEAYTKLLMVVAIDGVRAKVLMQVDNATIETALADSANTPKT
jgi:hypothetical protein